MPKNNKVVFVCTFDGCRRRFCSKDAWMAHEAGAHFQLGLWKCLVVAPQSGELCGALCFREESRATHLSVEHGIVDEAAIAAWTKKGSIGRDHEETFWCGFCKTVVPLTSVGSLGSAERFDHLGAHFEGGASFDGYLYYGVDAWDQVEDEVEDCGVEHPAEGGCGS